MRVYQPPPGSLPGHGHARLGWKNSGLHWGVASRPSGALVARGDHRSQGEALLFRGLPAPVPGRPAL